MTELDRLHQRGIFFCDYVERHLGNGALRPGLRESLEKGYREKNLKGYRMAIRDIDAWVRHWDDVQIREELNRQWKAGPGAGQPPFGGKPRELAGILRRGVIRNKGDYRIVHDYLSDYYCDGETNERLSAMLEAFEIT